MADFGAWLSEIGLGRHAEALRANDVDFDVLRTLTEADLKELGLSLGDRKRLLQAIAARTQTTSPAASSTAPVAKTMAAAERRQLTVMFVDLVGSTALSARLDPEEMRDVLRAYQNTVAGEISRLDGFTAKLMGDGVLAYFGWPRTHEDEAERAVRSALAIVAAVAKLSGGGETLSARVGIATGLVVVGDLAGEGAAQEQAVVGDTPNLAARLQGVAEPGMVVIAEGTRRLLGDVFELRDLGAQSLKGLAEPVPAFAVLGERAIESRFAARQGGGVAPLVGRDQELGLLLERWRQARSGDGQVVVLSGEAGIGKSRITEALVEAAAAEPHFLLRYQCSPYHADSALYPAIQHLTHAAGFAAEDDNERRLDKLEALLRRASDDIGTTVPLMAALLDIDATARYGALTLTPQQQRRSRTLAALVNQMTGLAARKPVLWVIEDAHWIDPTTLELIELALDRVQGARVLLLITARPTFVSSFASHPVVTRLALNRLARAATQAIVARITRGKRLPEALLDEIAARTDGVPLFVEEMTKAVIESGVLRESVEAYHLDGPLSALAIPTTLHDSLMARLDRLQPVKEVAQTAAVIGRGFDHRTIASLAGLSETALAEAMGKLVAAELVFRRGAPPDATYLFKHALVRDVAYESLLKAKRVALHARLLDILERQGDAPPEIKARHAEAAGLAERALDYWEQAGTQALARPAYKEAIASFENAIRLCRVLGDDLACKRREQRLHLQVGQALIANQGYQAPATLRAFERALALAEEIGDPSSQLPALYGQWASRYVAGADTGDLAQRYSALAEKLSDTGPRLVGWRMLALERFLQGEFAKSLTLLKKAIAGYDPVLHRDLANRFGQDPRAAASSYIAWNLWHLGFPDQAMQVLDENTKFVRAIGHMNTKLLVAYHDTVTDAWLRRPDRVEATAREMLRVAADMALPLWHAVFQIQLGWALSQQGSAQGIEEIEGGMRDRARLGVGLYQWRQLTWAAEAYLRAGRRDEASACLAEALSLTPTQGEGRAFSAELHRIRAAVRLSNNDRDAAEADLRRALEIARGQAALSLQLRATRDLARLLAERGERRQAADLLAPIYGWFTEGFDTANLIEARSLLEQLR